jgi:hypothetical protein
MAIKEHEYIKQTLERYTNCRIEDICDHNRYHEYGVPIGSIMLVSGRPLQRRGIKDKKKQDQVFSKYLVPHLDLAFDAVKNINTKWSEVKRRLISDW